MVYLPEKLGMQSRHEASLGSRRETSHGNNFNALRLLLATLVLLSHAFELVDGNQSREPLTRLFGTLSFGAVAIDGFFLVSGYLITQSWMNSDGFVDYLRKRVLRIYPGFLTAAVISALVIGPIASDTTNYFAEFDFPKFIAELALLFVPKTPPVFGGHPYPVVNGAMWSITYEFLCYLLIALIGILGIIKRRRILFVLAMVVLILYMVSQFPFFQTAIRKPNQQFLMLFFYFLIGACFYAFRDKIKYDGRRALLAALLLCGALFSKIASVPAYAILGGYILFYVAFSSIDLLKYLHYSLDISYGVYLYGWPIQKIIIWQLPSLHPMAVFVLSVLCSYAAGYASWKLVEKPFLRLKRGRIRTSPANIQVPE
jgi:peptidoglycan/LPS O-acetylase OafA/YrhL